MTAARRVWAAVIGLAVMTSVGGCAATGYDADVAGALQQKVLAVSQAAAASDFTGATAALDEVATQNDDAIARGQISDERHASIASAIDRVRSDLEETIAAAEAAAAEAAAAEAAAAEAKRIAELPAEQQKQNNGNGNGNGKGPDKK